MYRLRVCRRHGAAPALHPVGNRAGPLRPAPPALRNADATTDRTSNPARSFALENQAELPAATSCQHFAAPAGDGWEVCPNQFSRTGRCCPRGLIWSMKWLAPQAYTTPCPLVATAWDGGLGRRAVSFEYSRSGGA